MPDTTRGDKKGTLPSESALSKLQTEKPGYTAKFPLPAGKKVREGRGNTLFPFVTDVFWPWFNERNTFIQSIIGLLVVAIGIFLQSSISIFTTNFWNLFGSPD
ncbi:MAG: hypothetical protein OXF05_06065 [Hyphomicrobiales bacterium]|nr:hypothetical protein [Hyphomicrobiales bacterium]MCY4033832.1 hypothetical protein [Hyphomicrobiales bacterium]MCY4039518.1 hypothetical protein [Hyphomicrobiales bacterium]